MLRMADMETDPDGQLIFQFDRPPLQTLTPDEIYDLADESLLREVVAKCHEDSRLELKCNGIHAKELGEYFSMWANTAPSGGLIIVGVRDDRNWEGCSSIGSTQINGIEKAGDYCPDAIHQMRRVRIKRDADGETDFVILMRVYYHKTRVVRTTSGNIYVRRGDTIRQIKREDEIRLLMGEKGEVRFETEPCGLNYPKDFDMAALTAFSRAVREKRGLDEHHTVEEILQTRNLGTLEKGAFIPNIACALLFAVNPRGIVPGCRVRFLRFEREEEGTGDKWNAVKEEFIDGTVPYLIERTAEILKSQLRTFSRLGTKGRFFNSPEYPEFAWYEALVNACAHRSYGNGMKNMPIFVKMFDDRLEIESPGLFPPFVDPSNFTHVPRNPFLMDAMYFLELVKCAREGTRRMTADMLEMDLPSPQWEQKEVNGSIVRVTLRNNVNQRRVWVDADVARLIGEITALSLTKEAKRCLNFCVENGKINIRDAERLTGRDWATAKRILMNLTEKGILEHIHRDDIERDPSAHFVIKKPDAAN
jgi:ATP-dependent DNA helicase RecG